jgi:hypothetical protein
MNFFGSNRSICIRFRISWHVIYGKTKGVYKGHVAILVCDWTGRLASSCDLWRVMIFFNTSPRRMWTPSRDNAITKLRLDIQNRKFLFTIIWNRNGFYVIDRLPNHIKMNSAYFMTNILILLEQIIFPRGRTPHEKRFMVHLDNCSVHTSRASTDWLEEHNILHMLHPPYSPNLASSSFYLFPTVKRNLNGCSWPTRTSFWVPARGFEGSRSWRIEYHISGLSGPNSRSKWRQWRLRQMINNLYI